MAEDEDAGKRNIKINENAVILAALPWIVGDTISAKVVIKCIIIRQYFIHQAYYINNPILMMLNVEVSRDLN